MPGLATADVIVVGAGLIGSAIATGLQRNGARVLLIDEGDVAFRAARGNFGLVWLQGKGHDAPAYAALTRHSGRLWPDFAEALREKTGIDTHYTQSGGLTVFLDEEELAAGRAKMNERPQAGLPPLAYEMLDRQQAAALIPALGPAVVGACHCPTDGHVNPLFLLHAMHKQLADGGAAIATGETVETIESNPGGGFTLVTHERRYAAERIVIAAGLGTARLAAMVGINAPVTPHRGQILVTSRMDRFMSMPTLTIRQTEAGSVMIGESWEEAGYDDSTTPIILNMLARRAIATMPRLAAANVVRTWGALRVMTPDGLPIYHQSQSHPGAFVTTAHSGVTLTAMHAGPVADGIARGLIPQELNAFGAERFHVQ